MNTPGIQRKKSWLIRANEARSRTAALLNLQQEVEEVATSLAIEDDQTDTGSRLKTAMECCRESLTHQVDLWREVADAIDGAAIPATEKDILRRVYLSGYSLRQVSADLQYSYRHTLRLYGHALELFEIPGGHE